MNELALFAGAGGGILGGRLLGWRTVCAVEVEPYAQDVLLARQRDGFLDPFPVWDDVRTFDGKPWRGLVDVVSGGFPCQDISASGTGAGIDGDRSGLWSEMVRIIGEVRPRFIFVENSPVITSRGLGTVLRDLAALRLDAEWDVFSAADFGADHLRERFWLVAHSNEVMGASRPRPIQQPREPANAAWGYAHMPGDRRSRWVEMARKFRGMDDGLAYAVDRTAAIGNGQVPRVAAAAFAALAAEFE